MHAQKNPHAQNPAGQPVSIVTLYSQVGYHTSSFFHLAALYFLFSSLIRFEVGSPSLNFFTETSAHSFARSTTSHGLGMVFLFIMPGIISSVGNFALPEILGFLDFSTPRLNNLAFWSSIIAIEILVIAISRDNGLGGGWTLYFPLTGSEFSTSDSVSLAIFMLHVLGLSSEFGAVTFFDFDRDVTNARRWHRKNGFDRVVDTFGFFFCWSRHYQYWEPEFRYYFFWAWTCTR